MVTPLLWGLLNFDESCSVSALKKNSIKRFVYFLNICIFQEIGIYRSQILRILKLSNIM